MVEPFFSKNACFFNFFQDKWSLWIKWCRVIIYLLFYMLSAKKLLIHTVLTWFLTFDKIQDGNHVWLRRRPPPAQPLIKYTSSCGGDQRLSTEGKTVSKYCNISKPKGFHQILPLPPPLPIATVGVWICVYVRWLIGLHTKGWFPLTRFWLRTLTYVDFNHINKIEAR